MMSARTSFLVWWGLPILCAGLGAFLANYLDMTGGGGIIRYNEDHPRAAKSAAAEMVDVLRLGLSPV